MSERYVCFRDCYHNGMLYKIGEYLRLGDEPNKHFALESHIPENPETAAKTAADDPRSNEEMRKILIEKYNIKPAKDANRKRLFEVLRRKEIEEIDDTNAKEKKILAAQKKAKKQAKKDD